jgi:hypothetical protein
MTNLVFTHVLRTNLGKQFSDQLCRGVRVLHPIRRCSRGMILQ